MESQTFTLKLKDGTSYGPVAMPVLVQWAQQGRVPTDAVIVPEDGSDPVSVAVHAQLAAIVMAPPTVASVATADFENQPGPAMIPYRNPPALIGYYLTVFSLLPVIGIMLGIPAVICGIVGLRNRMKNPNVRGAAHAWIAIIGGGVLSLAWIALLVAIITNI